MRIGLRTVGALLALVTLASAQHADVETRAGSWRAGEVAGVYQAGLRLRAADGAAFDVAWADVITLRSSGATKILYGEDQVLRGRLMGHDAGALRIASDLLGEVRLPVASLPVAPTLEEAVAAAVKTPLTPKDWSGRASLAFTGSGGNSDAIALTVEAFLERFWAEDHLAFTARVAYGSSEDETTADQQLARARWDHYFRERFYGFVGAEVARDAVQDVSLRALLNVGVGYEVWKDSDDEKLALEGGFGYRHESFLGDTPSRDDVTARAAIDYRDVWFEDVKFGQTLEFILPITDLGAWLARSETSLSVPFAESWNYRTSIVLNYQGDPAEDAKAFDWLVSIGVEYTF